MPPTERTLTRVLEKARRIWLEEARPFSCRDFPEYKPSYFRKITSILSGKGLIYRWHGKRTKPQFWVPALEGNYDPHGGACKTMLALLGSLNWSNLFLHDIRLRAFSPELCRLVFELYPHLRDYSFCVRKDGSIVSPAIRWGRTRKRRTQAVFYRSGTILVEISCSCDPIPLEDESLRYLRENLLDLRRRILNSLYRVTKSASIPLEEYIELPESWIVVQGHINRDANPRGIRIENLPAITFADFSRTVRLYYQKKLSKIRAEAVVSPEIPLRDFFKQLGLYELTDADVPHYIA